MCSGYRRVAVTIVTLLAFLLQAGCGTKLQNREIVPVEERATLSPSSLYLKAHVRDGSVYVLEAWSIDETAKEVHGNGRKLDVNRAVVAEGPFTVPLDDVVLFETNEQRTSPYVGVIGLIAAGSIALTIVCIADPKACFGSCPTFYCPSDDGEILQAEGFSASVLPSLEATDVDALYRAAVTGDHVQLRVTNEALETHMIRQANLLVVPRTSDSRVLFGTDKRFWSATDLQPPVQVMAESGEVTALLDRFDGVEYKSLADSTDLAVREELHVTFEMNEPGRHGLVIAARQSFLTTYLFYQALAFLGTQAGDWIARIERDGIDTRQMLGGPGKVLGGIEVCVPDSLGGWRVVESVHETGPLATDVHLVRLPDSIDCSQIRLRMAKGHWRIDQLQLVSIGDEITPQRIAPSRIERNNLVDSAALALLVDTASYLITWPRDEYMITYTLPGDASEYELFLESRGYYLEWMRDEWLAEENLPMAVMLFTDPARALKILAPGFKKTEPVIEDLFWGSRYAPN